MGRINNNDEISLTKISKRCAHVMFSVYPSSIIGDSPSFSYLLGDPPDTNDVTSVPCGTTTPTSTTTTSND
jgi:hypothetical protein